MKLSVAKPDYDRLWQQYRSSPSRENRDTLLLSCKGAIVSIRKRCFGGVWPETAEDLIQEGWIGLIEALDDFDPYKHPDVKFSTYASHRIVGQMRHFMRDKVYEIRVPAWAQDLDALVQKTERHFFIKNGRPVENNEELAHYVGCSVECVSKVREYCHRDIRCSYDQPSGDDGDDSLLCEHLMVPDESNSDPAKINTRMSDEELERFYKLFEGVKPLHQRIITDYFDQKMTQAEIAHELGLSQNYISLIIKQHLKHFRSVLNIQPVLEVGEKPKHKRASVQPFVRAARLLFKDKDEAENSDHTNGKRRRKPQLVALSDRRRPAKEETMAILDNEDIQLHEQEVITPVQAIPLTDYGERQFSNLPVIRGEMRLRIVLGITSEYGNEVCPLSMEEIARRYGIKNRDVAYQCLFALRKDHVAEHCGSSKSGSYRIVSDAVIRLLSRKVSEVVICGIILQTDRLYLLSRVVEQITGVKKVHSVPEVTTNGVHPVPDEPKTGAGATILPITTDRLAGTIQRLKDRMLVLDTERGSISEQLRRLYEAEDICSKVEGQSTDKVEISQIPVLS